MQMSSNDLTADYLRNQPLANGHYGTNINSSGPAAQEKSVTSSSATYPTHADDNEIELSSDDDQDQTLNDTMDSPVNKLRTDLNRNGDQEESDDVSNEPMETNESSNIQPITTEVSISDDRDVDDHGSNASMSNQSTVDTGLSTNGQGTSK